MAKTAAPALGWWGERFPQYMLAEGLLNGPLTRGQVSGAERGDARISFERGGITAVVGTGYTNTFMLKVKPLTDREWKKAVAAIAADADIARRFLSGTPGAELDRVFQAAGVSLFPPVREATRCDCWDRWDCRHARVLAVRGAKMLDANPFLWLEVLGRPREVLLAAVRAQLSDQAGAEAGGAAMAVSAERFLTTESDPDTIAVRPGTTDAPDALLKLLGPLPLPEQFRSVSYTSQREVVRGDRRFHTLVRVQETADDALRRYLARISRQAAELAAGDRAPAYGGEAPAGKRVPLKHRLAQEIEAAAEAAETALSLAQLHSACPTAAAVPWGVAEPALAEALTLLPPGFLTLARGYVGLRSTVLTGATFRHVISLPEWQRGRLSPGADWEQALALAGFAPPFVIQVGGPDLFAQVQPQVGDELQVTVTDGEVPALVGRLVRRDQRSLMDRLEADRSAVRTLLEHMADRRIWATTEAAALEVLLATGSYRQEQPPDPAWLLPAAMFSGGLRWGSDRTLTVYSWHESEPPLGRPGYGVWQERNTTASQFAADLMKGGMTRREVGSALACLEVWGRVWPLDQRDARRPPALAAFAHFLWNLAPLYVKGAGEWVPQVMARWFRFLEERNPALEGAFREHLTVCEMAPAFAWRLGTAPDGRSQASHLAWVLEGYRWLGPELMFKR